MIKEQIFFHHYKCLKEDLKECKVKGIELRNKDLRKTPEYFYTSSLVEARMGFRTEQNA